MPTREIASSIADAVTAAPSDATALLNVDGVEISYGCLAERISRLSAAVRAAGINRQGRVALILPGGPDLAIAFLGVASAAVCAPLNPAYSVDEFLSYFAALHIKAAIVSPDSVRAIDAMKRLSIPQVDTSRRDLPAADRPQPEDVALILQTSGTTSRPKIVPLTHRNLCISAHNIAATLQLTAADRCLNLMPLFHIHGLAAGLLAPLTAGGSVVCPPGFSATGFFPWLDRFHPTWYTAVPTMHQAILAQAKVNPEILNRRRLRFLRSSSAALSPSLMVGLEEAFRGPVIQAYGMTEAAHQIATNLPGQRKPGTVGFAAGTSIEIMDEHGRMLPRGESGEIVVQGPNLMNGYENAPDANEAAFRYGWFHTGDCGFFDTGGHLVISGRLKEIINRGGEKISPHEVEAILLRHPGVAEAAAFAVPHRSLGEAVGAAVVARADSAVSEVEIREFVAARLAQFKVPSVVKVVAEIPKTATGKIQRIGLASTLGIEPAPEQIVNVDYVAPRNPLEATLQQIWTQILRTDSIGIHDNFFDRGGDSLATTILLTRVAEQTNVEPSLMRFLDHPTIAGLAAQISSRGAKPFSGLIPIQPDGEKPALFCVPGHDGASLTFCNFARHLGPEQPLLAFPSRPVTGSDAWHPLEDLAAGYIETMQRHQPQGPYRLAGYCFGGFVAYEIARQLAARGESVELLALIDTYNPAGGHAMNLAAQVRRFRRRLELQRAALSGKHPAEASRYLLGRITAFFRERSFQAGERVYRIFAALRLPIPQSLHRIRYASSLSLRRYRPKPYPGRAILLRVRDLRPDVEHMGWGALIQGGIETFDTPYHNLGPQNDLAARTMAEHLRTKLK